VNLFLFVINQHALNWTEDLEVWLQSFLHWAVDGNELSACEHH
jgi:hypothetical protein